jgi:cytochrome P450
MMTPPTPFHELKGLPILGSLPPLRRDALSFFTRVLEEHGDRVFMRVPGRSILLLCHPQDIEQVLVRDQQAYGRSAEMRRLRPVFGRGLLASEGELWQRQRSLIQPNFQHNALAATYGLMWDAIRTQIASWRDGDVVDIHAQMLEYSRNIICRVLFGREFQPAQTELGWAVTTIFGDLRSEILYLRLWRRLPTRRSRQWNGAVRILNAAIRGYIGERRRSGAHGDDLLATLMGARDSQGAPMSDQQVHDEVLTFFLAGHETAALSLTWALYLLARHPDHQQASREEAQRVLSAAGHSPESYAQLRLIGGVVKETLRLYPPVWSMGREVAADTYLDGRALAKGTDVWICLHRLHRDPRWYSAPTSFDPTRWLQPSKQLFTYLPFGVGARVCIGRNFATAESVLGLAAVLREFRVEPADVSEIDPKAWITLRPDRAIRLRLSKVRADLMGDRDIDQV